MKKIFFIILISFFLIGCQNKEVEPLKENQISDIENIQNPENLENPNVNSKDIVNNEEVNPPLKLENKEDTVVSYFEEVDRDIDVYLSDSKNTSLSDTIKNSFITCIDFLFYEKPIKGVYFHDLTEETKEKLQNMILYMDEKIEKRFPNYKDSLEEKYQTIKKKTTEYVDKADLYLEEKIGEEKYQQYKDTVSKVWDITKDVGNDLLEEGKNVWGNIKSWYENATDKN